MTDLGLSLRLRLVREVPILYRLDRPVNRYTFTASSGFQVWS
jgi:hypothetical protein